MHHASYSHVLQNGSPHGQPWPFYHQMQQPPKPTQAISPRTITAANTHGATRTASVSRHECCKDDDNSQGEFALQSCPAERFTSGSTLALLPSDALATQAISPRTITAANTLGVTRTGSVSRHECCKDGDNSQGEFPHLS